MVSSKILPQSKSFLRGPCKSKSSSNMSKNFINDALVSFLFISRASCQLIFRRSLMLMMIWISANIKIFEISFFFSWVCFSGKLRNCAIWSEVFVTMLPEKVSTLASICWKNIGNVFDRGVREQKISRVWTDQRNISSPKV